LNRQELEQRLENVVNTIRTSETELKRLREEKKQQILKLNPSDLKNMSSRIRELEDQVEDSKLARGALEKEIQEFKDKKEPEAARIRKHLQEVWPAALAEYEKLKRIHGELGPVLEKITGLNNEMAVLATQHKRLIEESILDPHLHVPPELYLVANVKFDIAPPKSLDMRLGTEREAQRLADLFKEQAPIVNRILKLAGEAWPNCPACGTRMLAQRRGPNDPAYYLAADNSKGFVNFRCQMHGGTKDVRFPAQPIAEMMIGIKGSPSLPSAVADLPPNQSHGLETPGLTDQHKEGETK
jgi:hypothetical protein